MSSHLFSLQFIYVNKPISNLLGSTISILKFHGASLSIEGVGLMMCAPNILYQNSYKILIFRIKVKKLFTIKLTTIVHK